MIRPNVDLNESFEKLKQRLEVAKTFKHNDNKAEYLGVAIILHLKECTLPDTKEDIPTELFAAPQKGDVSDNSLLHY